MRILTTILFLTVSVLPSFGVWMRLGHNDSIESNLKVDSIVTIYLSDFRVSKLKSEYNENGKKVREFMYGFNWSENRVTHLKEKKEYIYDANNRLIEQREEDNLIIDYEKIKWKKLLSKTIYKYDTHGNKIEERYNGYRIYIDKKEKWKDKRTYSYDTKGNIIKIITNERNNKYRQVYMYDTEGNLLKETKYSLYKYNWAEHSPLKKKDWIEYKGEEIFYNIHGKKDKTISYQWNPDKKDIDTTKIYTYTYNEFSNVTKEEWSWREKTDFIYNNDGKKKEEIYYRWKSETKDWDERSKTTYTYDNNGNLLEETKYSISSKTDDMDSYPISEQTTYVYNEKGVMTAKCKIIYGKDRETKEWHPIRREEYERKGDTAVENYYCLDSRLCEYLMSPYRTDTYYFSAEK